MPNTDLYPSWAEEREACWKALRLRFFITHDDLPLAVEQLYRAGWLAGRDAAAQAARVTADEYEQARRDAGLSKDAGVAYQHAAIGCRRVEHRISHLLPLPAPATREGTEGQ